MLLTKDQHKFITKLLSGVSSSIRERQQEEKKDYYNRNENNLGTIYDKGLHHGAQAAYEASYHIAKSAAEESYSAEYTGADQEIESICLQLEAQVKFLEEIDIYKYANGINSHELNDKIKDQAALLKNFVKKLRLIIHLSKES